MCRKKVENQRSGILSPVTFGGQRSIQLSYGFGEKNAAQPCLGNKPAAADRVLTGCCLRTIISVQNAMPRLLVDKARRSWRQDQRRFAMRRYSRSEERR